VAHEVTHSIVSATADFFYEGESGALNESLADFIGMTVLGFPHTRFGESAQWVLRDLLHPSRKGDPERYSEYRDLPPENDYGGVHTNSGILNRALTRAAFETAGYSPQEASIALSQGLIEALQDLPWSPFTPLDEFAVWTIISCRLAHPASGLSAVRRATCGTLERTLLDGELAFLRE
jgi:hypothetical protein